MTFALANIAIVLRVVVSRHALTEPTTNLVRFRARMRQTLERREIQRRSHTPVSRPDYEVVGGEVVGGAAAGGVGTGG